MQTRFNILAFWVILLASCAPVVAPPTATPMPTATHMAIPPTPIPPPVVATPLPAQSFTPIMTPDAIQVAHWKEYQMALARCFFAEASCTNPHPEEALCEWDILGRSGQEIYVWAICSVSNVADSRKPLVIYLETDGSIREVKFGGYKGPNYNLELFPIDVQEKIRLYSVDPVYMSRVEELGKHLTWRLEHPGEPPLIVLSAAPQP